MIRVLSLVLLSIGISATAAANENYPTSAAEVIASWPKVTNESAHKLMKEYGAPAEISSSQLVWYSIAPFKKTILHKNPVPHNFPAPHMDYLEQVINYYVPAKLYDEMAMFDGSILLDRTAGEMAAKCHKEGANLLALNLAHKVATKQMNVRQARRAYTETIEREMKGHTSEMMKRLLFEVPKFNTAFPDVKTVKN